MSERGRAGGGSGTPRSRPLRADDLDAVVAIDKEIVGRSRRGYFEKRLAAALREPAAHIQVGVEGDEGLVGFVLARVLEGEFGRPRPAALLEAIGVAPQRRRQGAGRLLLEGLEEVMRAKGIPELETEAAWTDHELLRFLDASGFTLAARHLIGCPVDRAASL